MILEQQAILFAISIFIATLSLAFGFIALLKQKTYLDSKSGQVTEIEIPTIGKFRSNYPALLFVLVGGIFGYFSIRALEGTKTVTIDGWLLLDRNSNDLSSTEINVIPSSLKQQIVTSTGHYTIVLEIPTSRSFKEHVAAINFQYGILSGQILPGQSSDRAQCAEASNNTFLCNVTLRKP